jgi:hypothetical protein
VSCADRAREEDPVPAGVLERRRLQRLFPARHLALAAPPMRSGSGGFLGAERAVVAAQLAVAAVEQSQNGRDVSRAVDVMADTLGQRIGWLGIAVFDELVTLGLREAQLGYSALAIEHPELELLVTHERGTLRDSLDPYTRPGGKLVGDLIDERFSTWHAGHRTRSDDLLVRRRWAAGFVCTQPAVTSATIAGHQA